MAVSRVNDFNIRFARLCGRLKGLTLGAGAKVVLLAMASYVGLGPNTRVVKALKFRIGRAQRMLHRLPWRVRRRIALFRGRMVRRFAAHRRFDSARRLYDDQGGMFHIPKPDADSAGSGEFFRYALAHIPHGRHVVRCAVQFPELPEGGALRLDCLVGGDVVDTHVFEINDALRAAADCIDVPVNVERPGLVELVGHVTHGLERTVLRYIAVHETASGRPADYWWKSEYGVWPPRSLRDVVIGTTGVCNASCPHCPTNKDMLAHLAQAPMAWPVFTKLIDEIAESRLFVEKQISFGLFGDGLMDPLVVERARYVKKVLPDVFLAVNTNGGPFNERRHAELIDLVDRFSVHIEGITPEVYERLMPPLKASNVFPKVERLLELAPGRVNIACPISSVNLHDFAGLREYWEERGAHEVHILTFTNRTTDQLNFYDYALAPTAGSCRQEVAYDLIVDWDGKVLACCQDFTRANEVGDLTKESLGDALKNADRRKVFETLGQGRWSDFSSCRNCKFDNETIVKAKLEAAAANRVQPAQAAE